MKLMKCPECEETSTFTSEWTEQTTYTAPLKLNDNDEMEVDYNHTDEFTDHVDGEMNECRCDTCQSLVPTYDIEIVEIKDEVLAE